MKLFFTQNMDKFVEKGKNRGTENGKGEQHKQKQNKVGKERNVGIKM